MSQKITFTNIFTTFGFFRETHHIFHADSALYVPLKVIIQDIGLNWRRQAKKLRNKSYGFDWREFSYAIPDGSTRTILCININDLGRFLDTIDARTVPERCWGPLRNYQTNCARELKAHVERKIEKLEASLKLPEE